MLKRLIEVALPLKEVSEQSAKEKYVQTGNIATLHIWWARRPLAACRAALFALLIPDPDDPECPESFRKLVMEVLKRDEFKPKRLGPSPTSTTGEESVPLEDTPRNRCLEFIKHLVKWENSNNADYIDPARKLIAAAHKILYSDAEEDAPKVLDPFAGGGAIPLEALRLGCEAHAIELNPVAHLIELCTLVYPQKYGQPNSRPVPDYIKRLIAHNWAKAKGTPKARPLLDQTDEVVAEVEAGEIIPRIEITEAEYRKNPLLADVEYWGHWVATMAERAIGRFYPPRPDGSIPIAYLWARTVKSPDPTVSATIPLIRSLWLSKKPAHKAALRMVPNQKTGQCEFRVVEGAEIDCDPDEGTMKRGDATCPFTGTVAPVEYLRAECRAGRMGQQLLALVLVKPGRKGQSYVIATQSDVEAFDMACKALKDEKGRHGDGIVPDEPLPPVGTLGFRVNNYGLLRWGDLFNDRQKLALTTFVRTIKDAYRQIAKVHDEDYAKGIVTVIGTNFGRAPDHWATLCAWNPSGPKIQHIFGRQALPMVWDYAEANPFGGSVGDYESSILSNGCNAIAGAGGASEVPAVCQRGSSMALPYSDECFTAIITDPPYYDAVPYADLSDFFYVWHKRSIGDVHPDCFRTPLTPKAKELVSHLGDGNAGTRMTAKEYEAGMGQAFKEIHRVLDKQGMCAVMFAHKTTAAWETIIAGLNRAGLLVTASWPFHTESKTRLRAMSSAALASSVTLTCRKRHSEAGPGVWDDVRRELKEIANERLDYFWNQGIRGADFFISAIGPALSVFGQYERVTKLSGDEVTVGQFLDEVRALVTGYALEKILHTTHTATIDPESRFYVVWKWSYGDAKVPADESFKLAQALGIDTEMMWDKTGVLEKSGENVQAVPVAKRMKIKNLGDPSPDGTPGSLIDVLHRMCVFRDKGDTEGMAEFVARSGQARNHNLWLLAQAVSEILPDGNKEKQLMQGLLNQKEQLERVDEQGKLF